MSSNEPNTSIISAEDSEDRPEKRKVEDSEQVESKKVRGPDESQVPLYTPTFNPFAPMYNQWLNQFSQSYEWLQLGAAFQAGIQKALGAQEVEVKPEEADVSEDQRKVVLEEVKATVEVEEKPEEAGPTKDQKVVLEEKEAQSFTPTQIQGLQWAYNFNNSPTAEQIILLADGLQLSHETVKKYFEDRRKEMEEMVDVLKNQEDVVKMEAPQDLPLTQGSLILTRNLANHVNHLISKHHTTQEILASRVIGKTQSALSDMLRRPTPYEKLRERGRRVWERMLAWVKLCEKDQKAVLDDKPTECCPFKAPGDSPPPSPKKSKEPKRLRTTFTPNQSQRLREAFAANRNLNPKQRAQLAAELQLQPDTVNYYFMNRRKKSSPINYSSELKQID